jgi:O-succinylbenzoic acid--CoA ligase
VTLNTAQLALSTFGSATRLGLHVGDRWLCCLPIHHIGGLSVLLRSAFQTTTAVRAPRASTLRAVNAGIDAGAVTMVSLVPAMVERLLDARDGPPVPGPPRHILIGGSALPTAAPQARRHRSARRGELGHERGGQPGRDHLPGRPRRGRSAAAFRSDRADATGALVITGPIVDGRAGHRRPRGRSDARGRVTVLGRRDDVILSGGENIAPQRDRRRAAGLPSHRGGDGGRGARPALGDAPGGGRGAASGSRRSPRRRGCAATGRAASRPSRSLTPSRWSTPCRAPHSASSQPPVSAASSRRPSPARASRSASGTDMPAKPSRRTKA